MKTRIIRTAAVLGATVLFSLSAFAAARGKADFTRFYALGDSYGAGMSNYSLNQNHQPYSWPAIIAKQAGLKLCTPTSTATENCFAVPYVSNPGIGPELSLTSIVTPVPVISTLPGVGSPLMLTFGRPYNNPSVPAETIVELDKLNGSQPVTSTATTFAQFILRGQGTQLDQVLASKPTFVAIWLGGNDVLLPALGGTSKGMTNGDVFLASYNAMLDKIITAAPDAGIVVGSLPNPNAVDFFPAINVLPTVLLDPSTGKPVLVGGNPIPLIGVLEDGSVGVLPAGSKVLLSAKTDLGLGYGIPPALKNVPPFSALPKVGLPLPDSDTLTPTEIQQIKDRVGEYNALIAQSAAAHNVPVADIAGLFNRVAARQEFVGPFSLTPDFITGGFFSLDGFHLTDLGYMLFANEYIKTINSAYGTHIPLASISQFFANNGAFFPAASASSTGWDMTAAAAAQMKAFAAQPVEEQPAPAPRRFRAGGH